MSAVNVAFVIVSLLVVLMVMCLGIVYFWLIMEH